MLDPIEPASGSGNYVDMVEMNRTCMRDLDGDGLRDTIDPDIDGDGYNNSVEIQPVALPGSISSLNDTFLYNFTNSAGTSADWNGWVTTTTSYAGVWGGTHAHCDNTTSGYGGAPYFGNGAGHMRSPYMNLTCLLYTSPSPRDATLSRMPSSA